MSSFVDTAKALAAKQTKKTKYSVQNAQKLVSKQLEEMQNSAKNRVFQLGQDSKLKLKDVGSSVSNASQRATAVIVNTSKNTVQNAQEKVSSISRNAIDTTSTMSRNALNATTLVSKSALNATTLASKNALYATTDRVKALPSSFTQASMNVLETVDPREKARKLRNQIIFYVFSAIFVYGFATAIPPALSKYMIEKERIAQQAKEHGAK
ncbi:hypothetical protein THRCLA_04203 [Thraustotheca clavata]|uniref:Uncharacterized protein n=1 Tax=Thraustotheca clavata TaxID=74557 RepID=A0A1V9ZZN2_9STRA|nr:hypothetical protein THRCLA_04203 [Thraustotheca clavata]